MKMEMIITIISLLVATYYAFRYYSLCHALRTLTHECNGLSDDITQNQMLHLPLPNKHLSALLSSFNSVLQKMLNERQEYNRREKTFQRQIENISHDLRTPLTVILGYLKLISRDGIEDTDLRESIETVIRKADSMKNLLSELYDYSRLNAGSVSLEVTELDVLKNLRETLLLHHALFEKRELKISAELAHKPIFVKAEVGALERVFSNLLQNAGRYALSFLDIEIKESNDSVSVLFTNDTNTVKEADIANMFDRFYTHDLSRKEGGTGLGLCIAQSLAQEMGGSLSAYAIPRDGKALKLCLELVLCK